MVSQRDVVEVMFQLPQQELKHLVIVLSSNEAIALEGYFFGMMITSGDYDDEFTFPLNDLMFNKPLSKISQARLHLIGWFKSSDVIKNSHLNMQMKSQYFNILIEQFKNSIALS